MKGAVLEELVSSTGLLLALVGQDAMRRLREALTAHDLKPRQFQILDLLAERGPIGQRELGQTTDIDHSILVTMLNPLEAAGFITRERDAADRRRHVVSITPAGRRHFASATRAHREAEDAILAALTEEQRERLGELLATLRDANPPAGADDCDQAGAER